MTRISLSIELIWKIAREEVIARNFEKIEPEHFMMALLKFSEFTHDQIEKYIPDQEVAKVLVNEVQSVKELLDKNSIDSTRLRREIRQQMGKGSSLNQGGIIHRSDASRALFDKVTIFARDEGHDTLVAVIFLEYMLNFPTPHIKEALVGLVESVPKPLNTPLIDLYGTDLMNSVGKTDGKGIFHHAQSMGFINSLRFSRKKLIFIIASTLEETEKVIQESLIKIKSDKNLLPDFNSILFFGFNKLLSEDFAESVYITKIKEIINEANIVKKIILILPVFESHITDLDALENLLESALKTGPVKLVCPINELKYKNLVKPGKVLNSISESVWINRIIGNDVPLEL